jgi:hypothetical protein
MRHLSVTEKLSGYASVATSAGRSAGAATLKSRAALVDAVGQLVDAAVDRVLLTDDRVTSAADGKLRLSGPTGTDELAVKSSCSQRRSSVRQPKARSSRGFRG